MTYKQARMFMEEFYREREEALQRQLIKGMDVDIERYCAFSACILTAIKALKENENKEI